MRPAPPRSYTPDAVAWHEERKELKALWAATPPEER
jgi:hypothetical protein